MTSEQTPRMESPLEGPRFVRSFPNTEALRIAVMHFRNGNFGEANVIAARILAHSTDPDERSAAETLIARTRPDPAALLMLALALVLFAFVAASWTMFAPSHTPKSTTKTVPMPPSSSRN